MSRWFKPEDEELILAKSERNRANIQPIKLVRTITGGATPVAVGAGETPDALAGSPLYPIVTLCAAQNLPEPVPEYVFAKPRRWRFDYAWPIQMVALEINGGVWTQGRHNRGAGAIADMEKLSEAAILGWRLIYATPEQVKDGTAMDRLRRALRPLEYAA